MHRQPPHQCLRRRHVKVALPVVLAVCRAGNSDGNDNDVGGSTVVVTVVGLPLSWWYWWLW